MSGSLGALLTPKRGGQSTSSGILILGLSFPSFLATPFPLASWAAHSRQSCLCSLLTRVKRRRVRGENNQLLKKRAGGAEASGRQWSSGEWTAGTWVQRTPLFKTKYQETNMKPARLAGNWRRCGGMLTAQRSIERRERPRPGEV